MSHEREDKVRPVEADGIKEFDNKLPRWWVGLFYFTVVAGVFYAVRLHFFGGETLIETYNKGLQEQIAYSADGGDETDGEAVPALDPELLAAELRKPAVIEQGKKVYQDNCAPCHSPDGGGLIGPNLTDRYWIHGGSDAAVIKVVEEGVVEKGMVAWKPILGSEKVRQAVAYVLSLQGSAPQNPKAAEGELSE